MLSRRGLLLLAVFSAGSAQAWAQAHTEPVSIYFDWNSAALSDNAKRFVSDTVKPAIDRLKPSGVMCVGYTDTSLSQAASKKLSMRMANAVAQELFAEGVPASILRVDGAGWDNLKVKTGPGVRELQNRRVEVTLYE